MIDEERAAVHIHVPFVVMLFGCRAIHHGKSILTCGPHNISIRWST